MNIIALLNLLSSLLYMTAILFLLFRGKETEYRLSIKLPLILTLLIFLLISISNTLEHQGITDYLDPVEDLAEILYLPLFLVFINNWRKEKELKKLVMQKAWTDSALESLKDGIITTDKKGRILYMNSCMEELTGWKLEEARGFSTSKILLFQDKSTKENIPYNPLETLVNHQPSEEYPWGLYLVSRQNNKTLIMEETSFIKGIEGEILGVVSVFRNMEEYNSLIEQINHSHKMEAIGQLASGVAHDMNNMLTGILGAANIMDKRLIRKESTEFEDVLPIIFDSIASAKDLTTNLLSFSRKKETVSVPVDLIEITQNAMALAKRAMGKSITLNFSSAAGNYMIKGDPSQLKNAVLNLILNAKDSYHGEKGTILINTDRVVLDESTDMASPGPLEITSGTYIRLQVRDQGGGIHPDKMNRIFDPFFTTKEEGKGTGLGLSAVYGTVQSHHGVITVESEPGRGTIFYLYFPEVPPEEAEDIKTELQKRKDSNTIRKR